MPPLFLATAKSSLLLILIWAIVNGETMENEPKIEALVQSNARVSVGQKMPSFTGQPGELPIFPERNDAVYFVVAVSGGAKSWGRTLARALLDMGAPFSSPQGPPLRPIYVDLPASGRFSAKVLTALCENIDGVPISGIIVVGDGQAARSIALAGNAMKVPVLWAKGGTAQLHAAGSELHNHLQATLQPSAKEILEAIRAIFLQTHWHSFFVLSDIDSTMVLGGSLGGILKKSPLSPMILPLSSNKDDVFRQLAKISRSTRGIVLLLCDLNAARRVMSEAQRLKMVGGHFIWIWADTSSTAEFFQPHSSVSSTSGTSTNVDDKEQIMTMKTNYEPHLGIIERKPKYDKIETPTVRQKSFQQQQFNTKRPQQNETRYKNYNNNRFHHIIGLRKPGDESIVDDDDVPALHEASFFKSDKLVTTNNGAGHVPVKEKRSIDINNGKTIESNTSEEPLLDLHRMESDYPNIKVHKNVNNNEFNAHYYDPYSQSAGFPSPSADGMFENVLGSDFDDSADSTNENGFYDADKINPFLPASGDSSQTTRQPSSAISGSGAENNIKPVNRDQKNYEASPDKIATVPFSKVFNDDEDDLDLEGYSETSNDLKAKRADSIPSAFNISSHVFFHHFKDFPVGLLALRHIKMNIDRVFVRAAIRLFATTWSRVERDEELRATTGGSGGGSNKVNSRKTNNWPDNNNNNNNNWNANDYDFEESSNTFKSNRQKNKAQSRYNNARGTRKYKRNVPSSTKINQTTISNLVNSSNITSNFTTNLINYSTNKTYKEHVSGLQLNITEDGKKSNKNNVESVNISSSQYDFNVSALEQISNSSNGNQETVQTLHINGPIDVQKRQNTWWSNTFRGRNQDKQKMGRGTPQYKGGCFGLPSRSDLKRSEGFSRYLREAVTFVLSGKNLPGSIVEKSLISNFEILNLVPSGSNKNLDEQRDQMKKTPTMAPVKADKPEGTKWRRVGLVLGRKVHLDTIVWPGGDIVVSGSTRARSVFRVVTSLSPPFVMESNLDEDGLCLRGLPCHRLSTSVGKQNLTLMFNTIETRERFEEDAVEHGNQIPANEDHKSHEKVSYKTKCCYGLSMDLLDNVAAELGFGYILYIVSDELFGSKQVMRKQNIPHNMQPLHHDFNKPVQYDAAHELSREKERERERTEKHSRKFNKKIFDQSIWNGIVGDLVAGSADMSFAPLSVSKSRAEVIDFSAPYFHSGVSLLAAPKTKTDIPLLAFLMPFSPELWIAIFIWLNLTAVAVAIYEWLSPFGLNPWGRQRSKNFSLSSALWVMWGLLCGHLVAFKAPKSWPNKFLINVWGGFSVIFIASYTANIAALIAGLFFHNAVNTYDTSLLNQRVGIPRSSAAESYIQRNDKHLWERMKKYTFGSIEEGIQGLKNGSIDLLMADSPILDYYRGNDHGCTLRRIGENYIEDTYAIGMSKGFPLKESISALIAKYSSNGYLDILVEKWYGGLPCYRDEDDIEIVQPRPLGVAAVAGVFLLLGLGMILGVLILIFEHMFFKYYLPILRLQPKGSVWRSRNIMFFSQKLYRFINCVELVSPHHAARELVHTLRKGHITSLFQKSVKRKEDEQRRRRKSKAQFFEMIQEIRRVQQSEKEQPPIPKLSVVDEIEVIQNSNQSQDIQSIASSVAITPVKPKASPKLRIFSLRRNEHSRSTSSSLNVRRFSTDSILGERLDTIGRRLSRDIASDLANSPPDLGHRFETFGKTTSTKFDTFSGITAIAKSADNLDTALLEKSKFDTFSGAIDEIKPALPVKKNPKSKQRRKPLSMDVFDVKSSNQATCENQSTLPLRDLMREPIRESFRESLHPAIFQHDSSKAILRDKLHEELRAKYGTSTMLLKAKPPLNTPPRVPSLKNRPPLKKTHNPNDSFLKVQSNDSLNLRPTPTPRAKPRNFSGDDDDDDGPDPTYATIQPRNKSPRVSNSNLPLGRLSKEDLLNLSHQTESEIHEFLNGKSNTKNNKDPP